MEINITKFFNDCDAFDFASSQYERGENAGQETWNNAVSQADSEPLLTTPEQLQAMRDYARESGGWTADEIAEWTDTEVNALFIQFVSGDMRQIEDLCSNDEGDIDWTKYQELAERGTISGSIYRADIGPNEGDIFYYLGN